MRCKQTIALIIALALTVMLLPAQAFASPENEGGGLAETDQTVGGEDSSPAEYDDDGQQQDAAPAVVDNSNAGSWQQEPDGTVQTAPAAEEDEDDRDGIEDQMAVLYDPTNDNASGFSPMADLLATATPVQPTRGLPTLNITLSYNVSLSQVHQDGKDVKYANNAVALTDASNPANNITVSASANGNGVEFKGRGNVSWTAWEKKSYQIKFSSKTSVLGMPKAKKWTLLAHCDDGTAIRDKLSLDLGSALGLYCPKMELIELYVNGDYRGLYSICEKIEVGDNRVKLVDPYGVIAEIDNHYYDSEPYWFRAEDRNEVVLKESVADDESSGSGSIGLQAFASLKEKVDALVNRLATKAPWAELSQSIDVESFARYYVAAEFSSSDDNYRSSTYIYTDGQSDTIHMGPLWDMSSSMDVGRYWVLPDSYARNYSNSTLRTNKYNSVWMVKLLEYPEFRQAVESVWTGSMQAYMPSISAKADALSASIAQAYAKDASRWQASFPSQYPRPWNLSVAMNQLRQFIADKSEYMTNNNAVPEQIQPGVYSLKTPAGLALDVEWAAYDNCTNIQIYTDNGTEAQKFYIQPSGDGYYYIRSMLTLSCMDVSNGSKEFGANVWQYEMNKTWAQKWELVKKDVGSADEAYALVSALSGYVLDVTNGAISSFGTNVWLYSNNDSPAQHWLLEACDDADISVLEGDYYIKTPAGTVLDVKDGMITEACSNVWIYAKNNTPAQQFRLERNADRTYTIGLVGSSMVLDASYGGTTNGTNLWIWSRNGTDAQKFLIVKRGDSYRIVNLASGKEADVSNGFINIPTANVQLYSRNDSPAQQWSFEPVV